MEELKSKLESVVKELIPTAEVELEIISGGKTITGMIVFSPLSYPGSFGSIVRFLRSKFTDDELENFCRINIIRHGEKYVQAGRVWNPQGERKDK